MQSVKQGKNLGVWDRVLEHTARKENLTLSSVDSSFWVLCEWGIWPDLEQGYSKKKKIKFESSHTPVILWGAEAVNGKCSVSKELTPHVSVKDPDKIGPSL